jgi:hypothetical protein
MNFTVVWLHSAKEQLADLHLKAWQRGIASPVTRTVHRMELQLARDPASAGESRGDGSRLYIRQRVAIVFEVHEDESTVVVRSIRLTPK